MKTASKIWILGVFLAFNACQPYSAEDVAYFETSVPYLTQGIKNMESQSMEMLKQMTKTVHKKRIAGVNNDYADTVLKKGHELIRATGKLCKHFDIYKIFGISDNDFFEAETVYLKTSRSNNYITPDNVATIDSVLATYMSFIEEQYPTLMTKKLQSWKKEGKGFLRRKCKNLPLIGAWARLLDIQIQCINQEQLILNHLITESEKHQIHLPYTEHLQWVFSEEKNTIKLGEEYKATLSLAIAYQMPDMRMEINGQEIPVKDGVGKLRLKAQGLGKKYWRGKVTFTDPTTGKDTTFTTEQIMYEVIPKEE